MATTPKGFGDGGYVVIPIGPQGTAAHVLLIDEPAQSERTGLDRQFMTNIRSQVGWAVGGEPVEVKPFCLKSRLVR